MELYENLKNELDERKEKLIGIAPHLGEGRWWREQDEKPDATDFVKSLAERHEKKRLFVCCDGTWQNASGTIAPMTNVAKLARCVDRMGRDDLKLPSISDSRRDSESSPEDETDHVVKLKGRYGVVRQLVYYSSGVGAQSSLSMDSQFAGLTGKGVTANILNAYCFICNNFNFASTLDEIVLVGFSRGAFTVRCLANFISKVGLLRRQGLPFLRPLFRLWKRGETTKLNQMADVLTSLRLEGVKIEILAEWDTVSAMGLPLGFWKRELSSVQDDLNKVPEAVKNAFLAFALDEKRPRFKPMLWTKAPKAGTTVKQCAFIGCHSDIGGGNPDAGLSTVSLLWMISKIKEACNAEFDEGALLQFVTPIQSPRWRRDEGVFRGTWSLVKDLWPSTQREMQLKDLSSSKGRIHESRVRWWLILHCFTLGLWSGKRDNFLTWTAQQTPQEDWLLKIHFTAHVLNARDSLVKNRPFTRKRNGSLSLSKDEPNQYENWLLREWEQISRRDQLSVEGNVGWNEIANELRWGIAQRDIDPLIQNIVDDLPPLQKDIEGGKSEQRAGRV